jgi:hypothetical protein
LCSSAAAQARSAIALARPRRRPSRFDSHELAALLELGHARAVAGTEHTIHSTPVTNGIGLAGQLFGLLEQILLLLLDQLRTIDTVAQPHVG